MPSRLATATIPALPIVLNSEGTAPEWIHLLPAGTIKTNDGRGPYRVLDTKKLMAESLPQGERLPIDENHATDLASPQGGSSPARGWIVELAERADGIWGRVEWTKQGAELLADRAYRHISPAIQVLKDGTVLRILRAALVNTPNLRGLIALNSEGDDMDLMAKLREALGLAADATEEVVLNAVKSAKEAAKTALQSVAKAAGLKDDAKPAEVLQAVTTLAAAKSEPGGETVKAMQTELAEVTKQLNALKAAGAKDKATAFVDGAIKEGRVGVKALRDHYIERHASDPAAVEKEIAALPKLTGATIEAAAPPAKDGQVALNAEQRQAAKLLGIPEDKYAATLKAEREKEEVN